MSLLRAKVAGEVELNPVPTYEYVERRSGRRGYYITYDGVRIGGPFKTKRLAKIAMEVSLLSVDEAKPHFTYAEIEAMDQGQGRFRYDKAKRKSDTKKLWRHFGSSHRRAIKQAARRRR
jgi:hypothetical protein